MIFICPVCTRLVDEYGDPIPVPVEIPAGIKTKVCTPCRLEVLRFSRFGPKTIDKKPERYVSLPYKDDP